ncbi:galactokinase family protein [Aureisphaera galaxeae]|uniref:mevalonate kinase family protein n=1 Tax=Aureisphaera galaxeae TaxID=1538023 RepID=UPI002351042F|nr:galactokinase family protein [Aureisphaera galaxeae]MDC8006372.1 galactokinase family protein [Aureisphaera galaxeae]
MKQEFTVIAPGRICLFGDHQDYLGLPVIACAIDRSVQLEVHPNGKDIFEIHMPDIGKQRTIAIGDRFENLEAGDHMGAVMRVVPRYGCHPNKGYHLTLTSSIPINAGISSSSAVVVAWVHFLLHAFGCDRPITQELIAQIAYEAEVIEHNSPGGKMDQYSIGLGNIVHIETGDVFAYHTIGDRLDTLIIGESGVTKSTIGVLGSLRSKAEDAIAQVAENVSDFDLYSVTNAEIESLTQHIEEPLRPYFYAAIQNHSITQEALKEFEKEVLDIPKIGKLMTNHHEILRDILGITVPKIDAMIDGALEAEAFGAKIVGSGGGGCICALTSEENKDAVIDAILRAGAKDAYAVKVSGGTYIE